MPDTPPGVPTSQPSSEQSALTLERYQHLEGELGSVKSDLAGVKTDLAGVKTDIGILGQSYHSLKDEMSGGFRQSREDMKTFQASIKEALTQDANQPASIKVSLLLSFVGVLFPTIAMAGAVILLLVNPLRDNITALGEHVAEHERSPSHTIALTELPLLRERIAENKRDIEQKVDTAITASKMRSAEQQRQIDDIRTRKLAERAETLKAIAELRKEQIVLIKESGRQEVYREWNSKEHADAQRNLEALRKSTVDIFKKVDNVGNSIGELQGRLKAVDEDLKRLNGRVNDNHPR